MDEGKTIERANKFASNEKIICRKKGNIKIADKRYTVRFGLSEIKEV